MQTYIQSLQHSDLLVSISSLQVIVFQYFQIICTAYEIFVADPKGIRDKKEHLSTINVKAKNEYYTMM